MDEESEEYRETMRKSGGRQRREGREKDDGGIPVVLALRRLRLSRSGL